METLLKLVIDCGHEMQAEWMKQVRDCLNVGRKEEAKELLEWQLEMREKHSWLEQFIWKGVVMELLRRLDYEATSKAI